MGFRDAPFLLTEGLARDRAPMDPHFMSSHPCPTMMEGMTYRKKMLNFSEPSLSFL